MSKRLSFSIAVNLLTENFKKGTNTVKNSLRSIQMQILTFAAALGVGGLGLSGLITRFRDVARETSRVLTALKNVSSGTKGFADNLRFVNDMAKRYGLEVNALTGNFAKFTASATQANMPMDQQRKVFESLSRASTAFGLSAEDTNGVFLALSQMMGKGKISSEELRKQMGERIPIAMQAMAKAAGVSMAGLEKLLKQGKLGSSEIIPKFAEALNEMIPNVDIDNIETSLNRLSNVFGNLVDASGFQGKYKALIDTLTSIVDTASKNIENIVVGIVASIAFVVTNASAKVLKGWWSMGSEMATGQQKLNTELTRATASRVAAENALEASRLKYSVAIGKSREKIAQDVALKEKLYARSVIVEDKAKLALETANNAKKVSVITKGFNTIKVGAAKLAITLKSLWTSFAPAIIVSGLIAIGGYIKNVYDKTKWLEKATEDYNKDVATEQTNIEALFNKLRKATEGTEDYNKIKNEIISKYGSYLQGLSKEIKTLKDVEGAYKAISSAALQAAKDRAIGNAQTQAYDKYTSSFGEDATELQKLLVKEYGKGGGDIIYDNIWKSLNQGNDVPKEFQKFIDKSTRIYTGSSTTGYNPIQQIVNRIQLSKKKLNKELEEIKTKFGESSGSATNNDPIIPTTPDTDPDDKALRAAEKRLEALRKLDEEDRKRQIEKQKFDLDLQQKAIDVLDDSFDKRIKQTLLNLKNEKLAIEEKQNELLQQQSEYVKTKYVSEKGTDKGFGTYFKQLQNNNFKDASGVSILPEGLRPEDIERQVNELLSAAQNAQRKGLADINKDLSTMLREQQLMFASDLAKKLADLDTYYNEQRIKAGSNADLIKQIESNRTREKQSVITDDKLEKLDFEEQLKLERIAGMESIGMTEFVEEKKLEITRRYLQLRINALDKLAFAGDEEAFKQMQLLQSSLNKLDTQKPVKSLKSLADKAIFDTIKKGFEKAGDSAEEAEEKTTGLLGAISEKAGMVANITSELQAMFGGLDESLDMALETVGNIAQGFATGGIVGGAMAVIGEGMKLFSKASEAAARHQEALKEIAEARLASQRAYNLLLREQNLLLEEAVSIFGEKQITRASNAIQNYRESISDLQKEMQGTFAPDETLEKLLEKRASSGGISGMFSSYQLKDYKRQVDNYNKGIAKLADQQIVTGHKKTGLFGWGKGKDTYSSLLEVYPDVIDAEGKLNKARLQTIIDTRKMSDETKAYLQNLIALEDAAEAAQEELRNYLQSTFGALGDDIMTSIENAIRDRGIDAWKDFGDAGAKVIEQLGKQIAYELFFADKFKKLQSDLEAVYGSNKSEEDIARASMDLIGKFYQNIGKDMELAQGFMENWQKEAAKYGLSLWANDSTSQSASKGYSVSMDQDTGDKMVGILTSMQMSGFKMEGLLSAISMDTSNIFRQMASVNSEMSKQTTILNNIYQVQRNSFFEVEGTGRYLKEMNGKLSNIETYTKALE